MSLHQATYVYTQLMTHATSLPNAELFAKILASQATGIGSLPADLGLGEQTFSALLVCYFHGTKPTPLFVVPSLVPSRRTEWEELTTLLLEHRAGISFSEQWLAKIVATACMGGNHLWQDLGLWSRNDVTDLMTNNFPTLAANNRADMKWKKFLYKQLCQREGIYICRAPSCEDCTDYSYCFGAEG